MPDILKQIKEIDARLEESPAIRGRVDASLSQDDEKAGTAPTGPPPRRDEGDGGRQPRRPARQRAQRQDPRQSGRRVIQRRRFQVDPGIKTRILAQHQRRRAIHRSASQVPRESRHLTNRAMYGYDSMTPNLSIYTVGPGHYTVRIRRGVTQGVRRQIESLLRRAPATLWVNGRKVSKQLAFSIILDLLRQRKPVEIMLN